jgi:hypothetical protein
VITYVDASAAAKLLTKEPGEPALRSYLDDAARTPESIVSCSLLVTELRRTANRERIAQSSVSALLDRITIVDLIRSTFHEAGLLTGDRLRSLDALHIAAAIRVNADVFVSYDQRQVEAAELAGLRVASPSWDATRSTACSGPSTTR